MGKSCYLKKSIVNFQMYLVFFANCVLTANYLAHFKDSSI
jgi:hypothetical protein